MQSRIASTTDFVIPGYEIGQCIARGGMSEVFLATRQADAQPLIVKIGPAAAGEQTCQRLHKEHRLLLAVDHPNIVKVLDHGSVDDRPFAILEHIHGVTLRECMQPGRPMAWRQVAAILRQLSSALAALHAVKILHRDVKPENVLLDKQWRAKLIDLSVGTELAEVGALTSQGQFLGTVDYMAPEQRHRLHIDERTDQYSLAAVVFEMLTGHCCLGQFRRPSELNPRLTTAVDQAVLKGLERDPDDRYESVERSTEAVLAAGTNSRARSWLRIAAVSAGVLLAGLLASGIDLLKPPARIPAEDRVVQAAHDSSTGGVASGEVFANSVGMSLVQIPAGTFQMGATEDEISRQFGGKAPAHFMHETPKHTVTLTRPFWIGTCEVSVAQFRVFVEETGYQTTSEVRLAQHGRLPAQPVWNHPVHYPLQEKLPVTGVSWDDAVAFCTWLSAREDMVYRLPTEAEWEYACRAGTTGAWSCDQGELSDYSASGRLWKDGPAPTGKRLANAWGLHDMHGNVWEWCQDYYSASFYATSPEHDPQCRELPADGQYHVLRSGGYFARPLAIRSTMRKSHNESVAYADQGHAIGFRVVCDAVSSRLAERRR